MINNRSAKKYLRHVRSMLPCSRKTKKLIVAQIGSDISSYLEEHPEADYNTLLSRFGTPETIAISYIDSTDAPEVLKKMHTRKWILSAFAIALALGILIWASAVIYAVIENEQSNGGHVEVVIENI